MSDSERGRESWNSTTIGLQQFLLPLGREPPQGALKRSIEVRLLNLFLLRLACLDGKAHTVDLRHADAIFLAAPLAARDRLGCQRQAKDVERQVEAEAHASLPRVRVRR